MNQVDRSREDEWFRQNEKERLEEARLARLKRQGEREAAEKEDERARLRALHFMKCPKCGHDLKTEDVGGVSIDRCTFCEGIYLDAGELDALFLKREDDRKGLLKRLIGL